MQFLDKLDFVRRTAESARLYGIDFFSVLSRGSQYRVRIKKEKKQKKEENYRSKNHKLKIKNQELNCYN